MLYKAKICDICDLQKCLMQTWVDSEQNVIEAATDQWPNRLRSCVRAGGGHFEHMLRNKVFICIMWFIRTFYETVNVIWCICRLFRS